MKLQKTQSSVHMQDGALMMKLEELLLKEEWQARYMAICKRKDILVSVSKVQVIV